MADKETAGAATLPAMQLDSMEALEAMRADIEALGVLSMSGAARFLGCTMATIKTWSEADPEFPIKGHGGHGRAFEIDPWALAVWAFKRRQAQEEQARAQSQGVAQMRMKLFGNALDDAEASGKDAKALREEVAAQRELGALLEAQGRLVPAEDVRKALEEAFGRFRVQTMNLADRIARELNLDHGQRRRVRELCRQPLMDLAKGLEEAGGPNLSEAAE